MRKVKHHQGGQAIGGSAKLTLLQRPILRDVHLGFQLSSLAEDVSL